MKWLNKYQDGGKITPEQSHKNAEDLYYPVYDKLMKAYGYDSNDSNDYNKIMADERIHPYVRKGLDQAFGFSLIDFESGERVVPSLDDNLKEFQDLILNTKDDELRGLLKKDYEKAGILNMGKYLPEDVSMWKALKYANKFNKLRKKGYTFQDGGIIDDDRGQWAHPGKVTKINSNNITMQGVNYPVLGISNTGDEQIMMPGEDYKFDGESVTEYPMAQKGKKIYVDSEDDPRYKAYRDSLNLYNSYNEVKKDLKDNKYTIEKHSKKPNKQNIRWMEDSMKKRGIDVSGWDGLGLLASKGEKNRGSSDFSRVEDLDQEHVEKLNNNEYKILDLQDAMINTKLKKQLFNKNIDPIAVTEYVDEKRYFPGFTPDNYEYSTWGRAQQAASTIFGGAQDVKSVFNYSNVNPREEVIIKQQESDSKKPTRKSVIKKKPRAKVKGLERFESFGVEEISGGMPEYEAVPQDYKGYNISDKDRRPVESRDHYRRTNLRPNGKPYSEGYEVEPIKIRKKMKYGGWLDKY